MFQAALCRTSGLDRDNLVKDPAVAAARSWKIADQDNVKVLLLGMDVDELIENARVPVLSPRSHEGVNIDVPFNNSLSLHNSRLSRASASLYPKVIMLGRLVKFWAKSRQQRLRGHPLQLRPLVASYLLVAAQGVAAELAG